MVNPRSTSPLPGYATSAARHGRPKDISTSSCRQAAIGRPMDSRNQARWLSGYRLSFLPARSGVRRGPAILSGAPKAERKAAPKHIIDVSYPDLGSIEQHI